MTEVDLFAYFLDETLVQHFVEQTNQYYLEVLAEKTKNGPLKKRSTLKCWKNITVPIFYRFIVINFLMDILSTCISIIIVIIFMIAIFVL